METPTSTRPLRADIRRATNFQTTSSGRVTSVMVVTVEWCPIAEPVWDEIYVVSPRNAALYVFPGNLWRRSALAARLDAIGCLGRERVTALSDRIFPDDRVPPFAPSAGFDRRLATIQFSLLSLQARTFGLRRLLNRLANHSTQSSESVADVLRRVKTAEGPTHRTACLPRALARWSGLTKAGHRPTFVLGVALPAARMHSWITLNGRHIGEDPDELAGYQPAVSFAAADDGAG